MITEEDRLDLTAEHPDDGTGNWLNALTRSGWKVTPHCRGLEFEIKYTPSGAGSDSTDLGYYVRSVQTADLPRDLVVANWLAFRVVTAEYWLADGVEWSLQKSTNGERLKRKVHTLFAGEAGQSPLMQSVETFLDEPDRVHAVTGSFKNSLGVLRKRQAKSYLVRLDPGIVFNLTEARCSIGAVEQIQLEVEYSCHIHRGRQAASRACSAMQIRGYLWDLDRCLNPILLAAGLIPTTERKVDFARAAGSG